MTDIAPSKHTELRRRVVEIPGTRVVVMEFGTHAVEPESVPAKPLRTMADAGIFKERQ